MEIIILSGGGIIGKFIVNGNKKTTTFSEEELLESMNFVANLLNEFRGLNNVIIAYYGGKPFVFFIPKQKRDFYIVGVEINDMKKIPFLVGLAMKIHKKIRGLSEFPETILEIVEKVVNGSKNA